GYLHAADNAEAFDEDGFFRSGDLARYIKDDWFVISGRKKEIIIRSGENLSPKEIEDALFDYPSLRELAVVGVPNEKTGERVCLCVVMDDGAAISLSGIAGHLRAKGLAKQKIPEQVEVFTELPRTASGKVQKHRLRDAVVARVP